MTTRSDEPQAGSRLLADVSNAMVSTLKEYYGKGPTKAKSYMVDDYLIVVMQDPFTVVEHTLKRGQAPTGGRVPPELSGRED